MSDSSGIEWTEATWNPVAGCSLVSPGCTNCYAMKMAHRLEGMGQEKYSGTTRKGERGAVWTGRINLDEAALSIPFGWKKRRRIFVNSMSDLFHEDIPRRFIDRVFNTMAAANRHTYQILTKRPERAAGYLRGWNLGEPLPNVWIGTSIENQDVAGPRLKALLNCPAAVRWVSFEPLLGPVDVAEALKPLAVDSIDWAVIGGESGPRARACNINWIADLMEQFEAAEVPVFVKQLGAQPITAWRTSTGGLETGALHFDDRKGGTPEQWPERFRVRQFPAVAHV